MSLGKLGESCFGIARDIFFGFLGLFFLGYMLSRMVAVLFRSILLFFIEWFSSVLVFLSSGLFCCFYKRFAYIGWFLSLFRYYFTIG